VTKLTPEDDVHALLDGVDERTAVCGHTHVQFERTRLVNAGSVGWPWEDERGAYWAILDRDVELRRTPYDVEAAAAAIRATDFPFPSFADDLLAPRGAEATTRRFEEARRG
jgi:diadenosine tetraphosphatase ApaH/serine/threonine PP2A family protein phosphatase